ncbi:aminotransferase class V-fold PLP-dependent enzyme, partial [Candidatus Peregrinibacteria bacterium]|nr:aminotransferase class V-fold PLP-dependent enzyme [Candidatus Peregrinibacteria bacterium]
MFDAKKLKQDFPILRTKFRGKSLVYLDNASTTQKPKTIIDALKNYYENLNSNIHRGIHSLSEKATIEYENVRARTAKFINAKYTEEIIFTKNTTESINLVANTFGETVVKKNDSIIISALEHHSNLLPWRALAKRKKANLL